MIGVPLAGDPVEVRAWQEAAAKVRAERERNEDES